MAGSELRILGRPGFYLGALLVFALGGCAEAEPESAILEAWFRPVQLGFCPRYLIVDRHAWVVGKIAPGTERGKAITDTVFRFRGFFEQDVEGGEKVRTSCDDRPYPVFHLLELVSERKMALGEVEPKVMRGPGAIPPLPDAGPTPTVVVPGGAEAQPRPKAKSFKGRRKSIRRRARRRVKRQKRGKLQP